jgi:membrane-associated phospholipid phosphatase
MNNKIALLFFLLFAQTGLANDRSVEYVGDGIAVLIPAAAYATTFHYDDSDGRAAFYKSIATATATTFALKFAVKRERPDGSNDRSFPSAHTMYAFQGATFIHRRYGFTHAVAAYLGAVFVGYSRIEADKHYASDVLAGAAIGSLCSWFFTDRYKDLSVRPAVQRDGYGVLIAYRF